MAVGWHGTFPAATTQFRGDGALHLDATRRHIGGAINDGVPGTIAIGTGAENCFLDAAEKRAVIAAAREAVAGRVPLLAGVAECTTRMACDFAQSAEAAGLDGLMVLPAMVYKSNPRETIAHDRAVARTARPADHGLQPGSFTGAAGRVGSDGGGALARARARAGAGPRQGHSCQDAMWPIRSMPAARQGRPGRILGMR